MVDKLIALAQNAYDRNKADVVPGSFNPEFTGSVTLFGKSRKTTKVRPDPFDFVYEHIRLNFRERAMILVSGST